MTNGEGKCYRTPFEWLASYDPGSLANRWRKSLGGNFYCAFCNGKEKHHPTKCPLLGELGLKLIDASGGTCGSSLGSTPSAGARGGASPATPPTAAPAAVVPPPASASGSPSAPAGLTATVEAGDESSTDSFAGMGMTRGLTLNLTGLFLCTHRLPSVPLSYLPFHLRRPVLGCPWSWTPCPCWMWTIHRMILFSLRDLCRRCSGPSPLRRLWRDFDWS